MNKDLNKDFNKGFNKDLNKELIEEFYLLALADITNGRPLQELEEAIDLYEQVEEYEACAGILKAIHESGYMTIRELIKKTQDEY